MTEATGGAAIQFANEWANIMVAQVKEYARRYQEFAAQYLDSKSLICGGFFLGWDSGSPIMQVAQVIMNNGQIVPDDYAITQDATERSSNPITQELIAGQTDRAKAAAQLWARLSPTYIPAEVSWRHLQFLVEQTSKLDPTVSPTADILEISKSGKITWHIRSACK